MDIEELRQDITRLWHEIDPKVKISVAYAWEERNELGSLKKVVQVTEPEVLRILKNIPRLERDSDEYKAHVKDLVRLIRNLEPNESWYARIRSDVDFILQELAKIEMGVTERWILPPDARTKLEEIKRILTEFLNAYGNFIREIPNSNEKPQLIPVFEKDKNYLDSIENVLNGKLPPSSANELINRFSLITLRDLVISSLDLFPNNYRLFENQRLKSYVETMMNLCSLRVILPKRGEMVNLQTTEFEPGVVSEYPRGTIVRVIHIGYIFDGKIFKRARIVVSSGNH